MDLSIATTMKLPNKQTNNQNNSPNLPFFITIFFRCLISRQALMFFLSPIIYFAAFNKPYSEDKLIFFLNSRCCIAAAYVIAPTRC
jgi:hypothetical protein